MPRKKRNAAPGIGHNSQAIQAGPLKQLIQKIERIESDIAGRREDLREVYDEAKNLGYDQRTVRRVIRQRRADEQKEREKQEMFDLYMGAVADLPLFAASVK